MKRWEYHKPYVTWRAKNFKKWLLIHDFVCAWPRCYLRHGVGYGNKVVWLFFEFGWLNDK